MPLTSSEAGLAPEAVYGRLGALLLDAGLSVSEVQDGLDAAAASAARESSDGPLTFSILPQTVLVSDRSGRTWLASAEGAISFRQAAQAGRLLRSLSQGGTPLDEVPTRIAMIRSRRPGRPAVASVLGSALIGTGLATVFRCPWWAELTTLILGSLVGAMLMVARRARPAASVMPFVLAFASTLTVGSVAEVFGIGAVPLAAVCAPIAVLVPGGTVTNALLELTSADLVAGSARLIYGSVVLAFMSAGIAAGASVTGLHIDPGSAGLVGDIRGTVPVGSAWSALPPAWLSLVGVVLLAIGVGAAFGAGRRLGAFGVAVMVGTYGVVTVAAALTNSIAASGIAAAVMLVVARGLQRLSSAVPATVTFQPAFLLLVPGTVGLVALSSTNLDALATAGATFASVCIGTQVGALVAAMGSAVLDRRSTAAVTS